MGTASDTVALQKGCYTGQEIVAKGLKSLTLPLISSSGNSPLNGESMRAKGSALRQLLVSTCQMHKSTSDVRVHPRSLLLLQPGTVLVDDTGMFMFWPYSRFSNEFKLFFTCTSTLMTLPRMTLTIPLFIRRVLR